MCVYMQKPFKLLEGFLSDRFFDYTHYSVNTSIITVITNIAIPMHLIVTNVRSLSSMWLVFFITLVILLASKTSATPTIQKNIANHIWGILKNLLKLSVLVFKIKFNISLPSFIAFIISSITTLFKFFI